MDRRIKTMGCRFLAVLLIGALVIDPAFASVVRSPVGAQISFNEQAVNAPLPWFRIVDTVSLRHTLTVVLLTTLALAQPLLAIAPAKPSPNDVPYVPANH